MKMRAKHLKNSPIDPHKADMDRDEARNYDELRASHGGKKWTGPEARELSTNPSGRLSPVRDEDAARRDIQVMGTRESMEHLRSRVQAARKAAKRK